MRAGPLEPVAQEVEAELGGGGVSDVALVGLFAVLLAHLLLQDADGEAESLVDGLHPLGVAAGEVVVDGGDVNALAFQGVEKHRQRSGERFAFTGGQFGQAALVHDDAGRELHVEGSHGEDAPSLDAYQAECLGQHLVEGFAAARPTAQAQRGRLEVGVA